LQAAITLPTLLQLAMLLPAPQLVLLLLEPAATAAGVL
jgi:hypothetical protein